MPTTQNSRNVIPPRSVRVPSSAGQGTATNPTGQHLASASVGLVVAALEFTVCAAVLMLLVALEVVSPATALTWAAVILVPLSLTIGFLGVHTGQLGRKVLAAAKHLPSGAA